MLLGNVNGNLLPFNSNGVILALCQSFAILSDREALEVQTLVKCIYHAHRCNRANGIHTRLRHTVLGCIGKLLAGFCLYFSLVNLFGWRRCNHLGVKTEKTTT